MFGKHFITLLIFLDFSWLYTVNIPQHYFVSNVVCLQCILGLSGLTSVYRQTATHTSHGLSGISGKSLSLTSSSFAGEWPFIAPCCEGLPLLPYFVNGLFIQMESLCQRAYHYCMYCTESISLLYCIVYTYSVHHNLFPIQNRLVQYCTVLWQHCCTL